MSLDIKKGTKLISRRPDGSIRVVTVNEDPDMCQQQFKEDCDVNLIMEKFLKTGQITHTRPPGYYMDLVDLPDYQESLNAVIEAGNRFMELPAKIRLKFDNDPGKFIAYLENPENDKEAISLGLKVPVEKDPVLEQLEKLNENLAAGGSPAGGEPK